MSFHLKYGTVTCVAVWRINSYYYHKVNEPEVIEHRFTCVRSIDQLSPATVDTSVVMVTADQLLSAVIIYLVETMAQIAWVVDKGRIDLWLIVCELEWLSRLVGYALALLDYW